ncbi:MAG: DUF4405 domain-containing protein [Desulfobulbus sp.]|nr:DUF4405 domain-containing protein [Desulfobulbus sp.]
MRKITSLTLLLSFALLILTSLVLYVVPEGRVAYWSDWRWLGLSKTQWGGIHTNSGFLFLAAGVLHLLYNWKPIVSYLKNRAKQVQLLAPGMIIAFLINLVVVAGTLFQVPPFQSILDFGHSFKEAAAIQYGEPPYGHAELSPLQLFAKRTGLDLTVMLANLNKAGIQVTGPEQSILAVAKANGLTPKAVYDAMQGSTASPEQTPTLPEQPKAGMGHTTLTELCRQYGLDQQQVLTAMAIKGIKAAPDQSLKEIAAAHNIDPHSLYELIYEAVHTP